MSLPTRWQTSLLSSNRTIKLSSIVSPPLLSLKLSVKLNGITYWKHLLENRDGPNTLKQGEK
ncbi:hypothetical protein RHMOL_Rhmol13G0298900 [Rhododendron molle]|uniref:Uncharacterized protein n=1 Tax=Rhododendron molle TaxID=49168 RepID=A0ACC0LC71_RHOML|nr:hypothetical protein RHMOL_Rhmol13G0298900 [Rhododendron molle]